MRKTLALRTTRVSLGAGTFVATTPITYTQRRRTMNSNNLIIPALGVEQNTFYTTTRTLTHTNTRINIQACAQTLCVSVNRVNQLCQIAPATSSNYRTPTHKSTHKHTHAHTHTHTPTNVTNRVTTHQVETLQILLNKVCVQRREPGSGVLLLVRVNKIKQHRRKEGKKEGRNGD